TFNGIRFALGAFVLAPFVLFGADRRTCLTRPAGTGTSGGILKAGLTAGLVLFAGASLQQTGMVYTTAGNAGFITGLYVVIVPILGLFLSQRASAGAWVGAAFAAAGLHLLSITKDLTMCFGDILVFAGAFFWAAHVLIIGRFSPRMDSFKLALVQYAVCSVLSLAVAGARESITFVSLENAAWPILYGGVVSVGIAYTLQIIGQREAPSTHAAILMSLESVFAAVGGGIILHEHLSSRQLAGCSLMLFGMLVSQLWRARLAVEGGDEADQEPLEKTG
ncbi:MAG TPA: DMT family transporter, partial [Deltaproteobacteria bacterium]|nr:DMT family transporter [Deltaproteobacteria bacterium]